MTAFENYFNALKKFCDDPMYEIWLNFEPQYDEHEYSWTTLRGLGEVLLLNCGVCDGPSDLRHALCKDCADARSKLAKEAYKEATGRPKEKWITLFLCRIHTE